jgi:hypothetical protein
MITKYMDTIQLAHGFKEIVLDDDEGHTANGKIGFFLGDCVTVTVANAVNQQDPPFMLVSQFNQLVETFHSKTAMATKCANTEIGPLPGDPRVRPITITKLFPISSLWWTFFLTHDRIPTETYQWIMKVTRQWQVMDAKFARLYKTVATCSLHRKPRVRRQHQHGHCGMPQSMRGRKTGAMGFQWPPPLPTMAPNNP